MNKASVTLSNGTTLAYIERSGGQQPLVLLHGITGDSLTFEDFFGGISSECHVYALDHRGHGESSKPNELYSTQAYASDVGHFIKEIVGGPVLLAGHSLGGLVAIQVAASAPELVSGLLLEDPPIYFVGHIDDMYRSLFESIVVVATTLQNGGKSRKEWFDIMASAPDPYSGKPGIEVMGEVQLNKRLDALAMMNPKALQDCLDGSLAWDADAVLQQIQCPVMLLTGERDLGSVMTTDEISRTIQLLAECEHVHYPDVGHEIHDYKPNEWLEVVNTWVNC